MKLFLLLLSISLFSLNVTSQTITLSTDHFNVTFDRDTDPNFENEGFYDDTQLGNLGFAANRFTFHNNDFRDSLGEIRRWICMEVFDYIEQTIEIPAGVEIDVQMIRFGVGSLPTIPGFATDFTFDDNTSVNKFINTVAQEKILTTNLDPNGTDADMVLNINFQKSIDPFGDDYEMGVLPGGIDLFSVILHEVTHGLGFYSAILGDGSSIQGGDYSIYDRHIFFHDTLNGGISRVISENGLLYSGAPLNEMEVDLVLPNVTIPCFAPGPVFTPGVSLSHIFTGGFGSNDVMQAITGANRLSREYSLFDGQVLCAIGYTIRGSDNVAPYGCGIFPIGVVDNESHNSTSLVCYDVLANDGPASTYPNPLILDLTFGNAETPGLIVDSILGDIESIEIVNNQICFKPHENFCGTIVIQYRPMDAAGRVGNITNLVITRECDFDPVTPCSVIANGGFERGRRNPFLSTQGDRGAFDGAENGTGNSFVDNWTGISSDIARGGAVALGLQIGVSAPNTHNMAIDNRRYAALPNPEEFVSTQTIVPVSMNSTYTLDFMTFVMIAQENPTACVNNVEVIVSVNTVNDPNTATPVGGAHFVPEGVWSNLNFDYTPNLAQNGKQVFFFFERALATACDTGVTCCFSIAYHYYDDVTLTPQLSYDLDVDFSTNNAVIGDIVQITATITNTGQSGNVNATSILELPICLSLVAGTPNSSVLAADLQPGESSTNIIDAEVVCGSCSYEKVKGSLILTDQNTGLPVTNVCAKPDSTTNSILLGGNCSCSTPATTNVFMPVCQGISEINIDATHYINLSNPFMKYQWIDQNGAITNHHLDGVFNTSNFNNGDKIELLIRTLLDPTPPNGSLSCITQIIIFNLSEDFPKEPKSEEVKLECGTNMILNEQVVPGHLKYLWSTGANTATISVGQSGTYTLRVTEGEYGCPQETIFSVKDDCCEDEVTTINGVQTLFQKQLISPYPEYDHLRTYASEVLNDEYFTVMMDHLNPEYFVLSVQSSNSGDILESYKYDFDSPHNLGIQEIKVLDASYGSNQGIYILAGTSYSGIENASYGLNKVILIRLDYTDKSVVKVTEISTPGTGHESGDIKANMFCNSFSLVNDNGALGWVMVGSLREKISTLTKLRPLLIKTTLDGNVLNHKYIKTDIVCSTCQGGFEANWAVDISDQSDHPIHKFAVLLSSIDYWNGIVGHTNNQFKNPRSSYILIDNDLNINIGAPPNSQLTWWTSTKQAKSRKVLLENIGGLLSVKIVGQHMTGNISEGFVHEFNPIGSNIYNFTQGSDFDVSRGFVDIVEKNNEYIVLGDRKILKLDNALGLVSVSQDLPFQSFGPAAFGWYGNYTGGLLHKHPLHGYIVRDILNETSAKTSDFLDLTCDQVGTSFNLTPSVLIDSNFTYTTLQVPISVNPKSLTKQDMTFSSKCCANDTMYEDQPNCDIVLDFDFETNCDEITITSVDVLGEIDIDRLHAWSSPDNSGLYTIVDYPTIAVPGVDEIEIRLDLQYSKDGFICNTQVCKNIEVLPELPPTVSLKYGWQKFQSNLGDDHLGPWQLRAADEFYPGDFNGDGEDELVCVNQNMNTMMMIKLVDNQWQHVWTPIPSHQILTYMAEFIVGDYDGDGDEELLGNGQFMGGPGWTTLFSYSAGDFHWTWSDNGVRPMFDYKDRLVAGDYDGDGSDEILGFSTTLNQIRIFNFVNGSSNWYQSFFASSTHPIYPFMDDLDVGNFDGDFRDEILARGTTTRMFEFFTSSLISTWDNGGSGEIQMWPIPLVNSDELLIGNIDEADNKDELLFIERGSAAGWAATMDLSTNPMGWNWHWSSGSDGYFDDWRINSNGGINTKYLFIKTNENEPEHLLAMRQYSCNGSAYYLANLYRSNDQIANKSGIMKPGAGDMNSTLGGSNGQTEVGWKLYPNPTKGSFRIENSARIETYEEVRILTSLGQVVEEQANVSSTKSYKLDENAKGVYFVEVTTRNKTKRLRVVKQ